MAYDDENSEIEKEKNSYYLCRTDAECGKNTKIKFWCRLKTQASHYGNIVFQGSDSRIWLCSDSAT